MTLLCRDGTLGFSGFDYGTLGLFVFGYDTLDFSVCTNGTLVFRYAEMTVLETFLHIRLLVSSLGGSSGVELARGRSNGGRVAARRWPAGSLGLGGGVFLYNCIVLYRKNNNDGNRE